MARQLRIEFENTFYHVLSRGNERGPIFQSESDYKKLIELLGSFSERFKLEVWSYIFMGNHYLCLAKHKKCYVE